jgi:tetratricopeptide (TPR) repeat protein
MTELRELLDRYESSGNDEVYAEALAGYERALAARPDDPDLHAELAYVQECRGRVGLRAAAAAYERAIELDPGHERARLQLIGARAALHETASAIDLYRRRLAELPDDPREYRYLAQAYLVAHDYSEAGEVVAAGLELAPDEARLLEQRGEIRAATDHPEEALADWRRAFELDPDNVGPRYASAFLLERENRLEEAAAEWRFIIEWQLERGFAVQTDWPRRELARLEAQLRGGNGPAR